MRRRWLAVLLVLWAAPAAAQHLAHGASGLPHGIPDFPSMAPATERIIVAAGQTLNQTTSLTISAIGVHGTLTVAPGAVLTVDNLLIYADGALFCNGAEIVIRDRLIDTTTDPEQFGQAVIGFGAATMRGCTVRSQNPVGTRGHVLFSQRSDVDIEGSTFIGLGRTCIDRPLDSTTFAGETPTHIGTCQIGRYAVHFHHVMGPFPATKPRQGRFVLNTIIDGGKWGLVAHRSSFMLFEGNSVTRTTVGLVEEDASETDNHWIGNYIGQAVGAKCDVNAYDPEGHCPAASWFRGQNQILRGNVSEDNQRGFVWWPGCLEVVLPHPCALAFPVTIPKFPGADTTNINEIDTSCKGGDGSPVPCRVVDRTALEVSGNIVRRADAGLEFWWTPRLQRGGSLITNTLTEDVKVPVLLHYTDAAIDGLTATGCETLVKQFNDAHPLGLGARESTMRHVDATCSDAIYLRNGQLHQAPAWLWEDSRLDSPRGIVLTGGGQRVVGYPHGTVVLKNLVMPRGTVSLTTSTAGGDEPIPDQTITVTATNVNGKDFTMTWPAGQPQPPLAPSNVRLVP